MEVVGWMLNLNVPSVPFIVVSGTDGTGISYTSYRPAQVVAEKPLRRGSGSFAWVRSAAL
jgi:hypothetical protein